MTRIAGTPEAIRERGAHQKHQDATAVLVHMAIRLQKPNAAPWSSGQEVAPASPRDACSSRPGTLRGHSR